MTVIFYILYYSIVHVVSTFSDLHVVSGVRGINV